MNWLELLQRLIGSGVTVTSDQISAIRAAVEAAIKADVEKATAPLKTQIEEAEKEATAIKAAAAAAADETIFTGFGFKKELIPSIKKFIDEDKWNSLDEAGKKALIKELPKTTAGLIKLPEVKADPKLKDPKKDLNLTKENKTKEDAEDNDLPDFDNGNAFGNGTII